MAKRWYPVGVRSVPLHLGLLSFLALAGACGGSGSSGGSPGADASPEAGEDAGIDGTTDAPADSGIDSTAEAATDGGIDATPDATPDAPADTGSGLDSSVQDTGTMAEAAGGDATSDSPVEAGCTSSTQCPMDQTCDMTSGTCNPGSIALLVGYASGAYGSVFHGGSWDSPVQFASDAYQQGGGGIAATPTGQGVVAFRPGGANTLQSTTWAGTWPMATVLGSNMVNYVGVPAATSQTILVAAAASGGSGAIFLDTLTYSTATWTTDEATGAGNFNSTPAVAATANGDPLIVFAGSGNATYQWTLRTGTTWSAPADTPVSFMSFIGGAPLPALATRAGADQIVGAFVTGTSGATTLSAVTFSAGAWSTATVIATDIASAAGAEQDLAIAALPDGSVAVAYVTSSARSVKVGFFDGTSWGTFAAVPTISVAFGTPLSISQGASGAVLELAYVDGTNELGHTRLTDIASWTWTTPVVIDGSRTYSAVSIAVP